MECRKYWADYDLELLLGDIYIEKKDYKQAEEYYMSASYMCPSRFLPLYQLYELYKCIGNTEKASELAKILLEKPAKVNSMLIKRIKYQLKKGVWTFNIMNIVCNYATFIMFFLNVYLYIWNPLEKHYDLIKIVFGWVIALFVFNYLFRHSKIERIGYVISIMLLALAFFVIPI